ncbi:hypothetical protein D3C84_1308790 [compost metagenome]
MEQAEVQRLGQPGTMYGGFTEGECGQACRDFHVGFDPAGGGFANHGGDQGKQEFVGGHGTIPG